MKSVRFATLALVVAGVALAQDTRPKTTLKVPSRTAAVANAAMDGDMAKVRSLIASGTDVNQAQGDGMTALHWAAERGDAAMTNALLAAKASVKATTSIGAYTPLHIAAKSGNPAVVTALLKAGADAKAATTTGATAMHFSAASGDTASIIALADKGGDLNAKEGEWSQTPLVFASATGRTAAVRTLIRRGADVGAKTKMENLQEQAALEQAAARKRNAVLVSWEPEKHKVDSAAMNQAVALAPPGAGPARPATPQPKGPFTPTQLQAAIDSGRAVLLARSATKGPVTEEVDTINGGVAGFANQVGGVGGLTALHHAVRQGNLEAVQVLLDAGAPINEPAQADKTTPLLMAAINGQFDVAMLLIRYGANVNLAATNGLTPLYATINTAWAPHSRFPQPQRVEFQKTPYMTVVEALLKAGANPNTRLVSQMWYFVYNNCGSGNCGLENIDGTTPFWRASYAVDVDAMRMLVKYGADPKIPSERNPANAARGGGGGGGRGAPGAAAPIQLPAGVAPGSPQALQLQQQAAAVAGFGGNGNQAPLDPQTDSAARAVPPGIGVYPLHAAAGVGYGNGFAGNAHRHAPDWMPAVKYLVEELGADVNQRDNNGMTPLHHAASRGDNEMILYLVSKGADVKAVSRRGQTVVDLANGPVQRLRPFPETIALLEKLGAKNSHKCVSC
jgi:ankyrin repeat protein